MGKEKLPQEEINQDSDENTVNMADEQNGDNSTIDIDEELVDDAERVDTTEEESGNDTVMTAEDEYKAAIKNRKQQRRKKLSLLLVAELIVAGLLGYSISSENLQTRVLREHEMRSTGHIALTKGLYTGKTDFGYFSGKGQFKFKTGANYKGNWKENQLDGLGTLHIPKEGTYKGGLVASKKQGSGVFKWKDGVIYDGHWKNDMMDGKGKYITPDGFTYIGTFSENNFAKGTCTFKNKTGDYDIKYKSGLVSKAIIKFADGSTYEGSCTSTQLTGVGEMKFTNGDSYSGDFKYGKRSGQGVYTWSSGEEYDGEWDDDQMDGSGEYKYSNGNYAKGTFNTNKFYEGQYCLKNDFGTYNYSITFRYTYKCKYIIE